MRNHKQSLTVQYCTVPGITKGYREGSQWLYNVRYVTNLVNKQYQLCVSNELSNNLFF